MLKSAFVCVVTSASSVLPLVSVAAQAPTTPEPPPAIVVTAEGKRTVAPDRASVFLSVQNRARTPTQAGQDNARISTAIRNAVTALGIDRAQVSTMNYNVRPDIEIIHGPQGREMRRDSAFVATNTVRVEVRNLDLVSRVIDTSLTAGATNVMSVSYWLADIARVRREATVEAVRVARENAEAIATAAGGSLGALIELRTDPVRIIEPRPYMGDMAMRTMAVAQADVPTPVSPRDIDVTAYVTARWRFIAR
ncbi:MAG TPA: SIMPL domain-containing protein [Gemmatimonadaceae bacterium]|nr:SIMPL domain-containing protein [Gemmatimonadaceae bacterium]